jgi:hypothetical protein
MGLRHVETGWPYAPSQILSPRDLLQVVRVDALAISAQMIQVETILDRTDEKFICMAVCVHEFRLAATIIQG